MTALLWAAPFLILGGVAAIAWSILSGRGQPYLLVRARWAWRCRGKPAPGREVCPLLEWERVELMTILRGRKKTARPERSRT